MIKTSEKKFINASKIISANIWVDNANVTVAIELDVNRVDLQTIYVDTFSSVPAAERFILSLNIP